METKLRGELDHKADYSLDVERLDNRDKIEARCDGFELKLASS